VDFLDLQADGLAGELLEILAQLVDLRALLADQDAGARGVQKHSHGLARTLDLDLRDRRERPVLGDVPADVLVLDQEPAEFLLRGVPTGAPRLGDSESESDGMSLLAHVLRLFLPLLRTALVLGSQPRPSARCSSGSGRRRRS
jgi:hypothetical protein